MALNWHTSIPSSVSFWTSLDILIMGLTSNLVEILISEVHRPHGLLVSLHWISVIPWPLIDHTLSAHFRTNLVEIFISGSTDLINFWSHFIEFPSYPGLWLAIHLPCILDKLVGIIIRGSSELIKIWSYFIDFSNSADCLRTCCTFPDKLLMGLTNDFVEIFFAVVHIFDYLLVMLHCIFSFSCVDWPSTFCAFLDKLPDSNMHPEMPRLYQIWVLWKQWARLELIKMLN